MVLVDVREGRCDVPKIGWLKQRLAIRMLSKYATELCHAAALLFEYLELTLPHLLTAHLFLRTSSFNNNNI